MASSGTYYVYIIECGDGSLYTGMTNDIERRLAQHQSGRGAQYTHARKAVRIVYSEVQPDRSSALKREAHIKSWTRKKKVELIQSVEHYS